MLPSNLCTSSLMVMYSSQSMCQSQSGQVCSNTERIWIKIVWVSIQDVFITSLKNETFLKRERCHNKIPLLPSVTKRKENVNFSVGKCWRKNYTLNWMSVLSVLQQALFYSPGSKAPFYHTHTHPFLIRWLYLFTQMVNAERKSFPLI